jgi:hypothetical protein
MCGAHSPLPFELNLIALIKDVLPYQIESLLWHWHTSQLVILRARTPVGMSHVGRVHKIGSPIKVRAECLQHVLLQQGQQHTVLTLNFGELSQLACG